MKCDKSTLCTSCVVEFFRCQSRFLSVEISCKCMVRSVSESPPWIRVTRPLDRDIVGNGERKGMLSCRVETASWMLAHHGAI